MTPRILKPEETAYGKLLASDPAIRAKHDALVEQVRAELEEEDKAGNRPMTCGELVDLAAQDVCGETSIAEQFDRTLELMIERLIDARIAKSQPIDSMPIGGA